MFMKMETSAVKIFALVLLLTAQVSSLSFCSANNFINSRNTNFMQFTKETVSQEFAVEGQFKALHCCAKGYRSIEWFKDGRRYPWSSEDTSSLIVYPQAANQTIFARKTSKVDEGSYTCILRNDTHRMEHKINLRVLDSSPDVPLTTFSPENQLTDIGGSARFFCEAFVGKKDLPDIAISIKWYHVVNDNHNHPVDEAKQETVKREEEQIIGSYLTVPHVTTDDFGQYLCRVEMGNSQMHRLDLSAELINALPIEAEKRCIFFNPYFLATFAALNTILFFVLLMRLHRCWANVFLKNNCSDNEISNMITNQTDKAMSSVKLKDRSKLKPEPRRCSETIIDVI